MVPGPLINVQSHGVTLKNPTAMALFGFTEYGCVTLTAFFSEIPNKTCFCHWNFNFHISFFSCERGARYCKNFMLCNYLCWYILWGLQKKFQFFQCLYFLAVSTEAFHFCKHCFWWTLGEPYVQQWVFFIWYDVEMLFIFLIFRLPFKYFALKSVVA